MFSGKDHSFSSDMPLDAVTIIGSQAVLRGGLLHVQQDLRIDGLLETNILAEGRLVIGPKACVRGNVTAREMVIAGEVIGDIKVEALLTLQSTAVVKGAVVTGRILIEEGASGGFNLMIGADHVSAAPPPAAAASPTVRQHSGDGAVGTDAQRRAALSVEAPSVPAAPAIESSPAAESGAQATVAKTRAAREARAAEPSGSPPEADASKSAAAAWQQMGTTATPEEHADVEDAGEQTSSSSEDASLSFETDRFW